MTISVSSSSPIQHSMLDVRCSFFFSKPSSVLQRKNNLALMGEKPLGFPLADSLKRFEPSGYCSHPDGSLTEKGRYTN